LTFGLSPQDVETNLVYELSQGGWNVPALRTLLEEVRLDRSPFEKLQLEQAFLLPGALKILRIGAQRLNDGETILMSIEDITSRRRAEGELLRIQDELRQTQKMEAVGRLTGGVVHDFNNMLTAILGFSEILMETLEEGTEAFYEASEIKKAGERAATLTHQLLAFSRHLVLEPQVLSLNKLILEMNQMLRRLIGDDISVHKTLGADLGSVRADPGQMSQVILNLVLNARDAMPNGGVLTLQTENTFVPETGGQIRGLAPGRYVSLTITDSGTGMDRATQDRAFEPYFTTKAPGFGTGLGLATVSDIVRESGGSIQFASEVGRGTIFWIDLPRTKTRQPKGPPELANMPRGTETILVVEDESVVRGVVVQILKRQGYTVLLANQGKDGLALCRSHASRIDLLLSDIVMAYGLNGRQLAEQACKVQPKMRVLLMSSFTTDEGLKQGVQKGVALLQKPFTPQELAFKVRDTLDRRPN